MPVPGALNIATMPAVGAASQAEPAADARTHRLFGAGGADDVVGGPERLGVQVDREDGQPSGSTQQHDGEGCAGPARHDQEARPGATAGEGHYPLWAGFPAGNGGIAAVMQRVEIGYTLQGRPVDADIDDLAQWSFQRFDQFGKFVCDRKRVWPPGPVKRAAQFGCQREPDRAGHAPPV